tara:strand:+ start:35 stop:208 length:174 start_codon:yes stop_codon:yes gene_type:complete
MNDFFKKHTDTFIVLGALFAGFLWMNTKFNELEKDLVIVKTVLIMQKIMPTELAAKE